MMPDRSAGLFEGCEPGDPARVAAEPYRILGRSTDLPEFVPEGQVNVVIIALARREPQIHADSGYTPGLHRPRCTSYPIWTNST